MYHGRMLASAYKSDWVFTDLEDPAWQHERCNCQVMFAKSGVSYIWGGHRDRYFGRNGRSRKVRQQERRRERRRENRLVRRYVLDEMS